VGRGFGIAPVKAAKTRRHHRLLYPDLRSPTSGSSSFPWRAAT